MGEQVPGGVSVFCWLATTIAMFYRNIPEFCNKVNSVFEGPVQQQDRELVKCLISGGCRYIVMPQNVMQRFGEKTS